MADYTRAEIVRRIATMGRLQLAGADLAGLDMAGLTLVGADLSYADLTEADLTGAQLSGASLWSARAAGARFFQANLSGASMGLADLSGADLREAVLERADLTGARLDRADLTGARLRGAWLDAMQRALAISAPPLRYPAPRDRATTCILHEAQLGAPVCLRCGDRLEMHLDGPTPAAHVEGAPILSGPEPPDTAPGPLRVLAFSAVAPGRARLVLDLRQTGKAPIALEVLVTP
ncbi:pentapeptide repeat-containing protein [Paracoccus sp. DMF]|uniref:pentapeptide repeat-containing protein n=1 Tax=Paracoccus sp. DMF TaxID=400837 RepID=UPI0021E4C21B|nr:pentapeptide repeat-containing protein [Paracoccus sp. DMF]MCV2449237.1 pentapeptide repeat-containing protein [Paracoccus sp. DMF]